MLTQNIVLGGVMNYRIEGTRLGIEDHGLFTMQLFLYDGECVRIGTPALCGFSCDYLRKVLEVVDVTAWEDLEGKYVQYEDGILSNILDKQNSIDLKKVI